MTAASRRRFYFAWGCFRNFVSGARRRTAEEASLAERKRQQAGAQQHEAGRGQCEESVGDQIVVAHDTPATLDARPNLLKLYESPASKEVMHLSTWEPNFYLGPGGA